MNNQFCAFWKDFMCNNIRYHSFCNLVYKEGFGKQFQIYNKHWHFWISKQVQSQSNICQLGKKDNHKRLFFLQIFWKCSYHHSRMHRTSTRPVKIAWHFRIRLKWRCDKNGLINMCKDNLNCNIIYLDIRFIFSY